MCRERRGPDKMEDAYNPNIITVTDDDGTEHVFEELDRIETDTNRYVALMPSYEDSAALLEDDGELIIVRVAEENGETFLYPIEDDGEFNEIAHIFEERLQDLFEIDVEEDETT